MERAKEVKENRWIQIMPENVCDNNCSIRKKRPERQLYIPPAQRFLTQKGTAQNDVNQLKKITVNARHELNKSKKNIKHISDAKQTKTLKVGYREKEVHNLGAFTYTNMNTISTPNNVFNKISCFVLSDIFDFLLSNNCNLLFHKYQVSQNNFYTVFRHICEFQKYLNFKRYYSSFLEGFLYRIPIFICKTETTSNILYILNKHCLLWQPKITNIYNIGNFCDIADYTGRIYPLHNFTETNFEDNTVEFQHKINGVYSINFETSYKKMLSLYDDLEVNAVKVVCEKNQCSVSKNDVVVDLSAINFGHIFIMNKDSDGSFDFYECREGHNILVCYLDKKHKYPGKKQSKCLDCTTMNVNSKIRPFSEIVRPRRNNNVQENEQIPTFVNKNVPLIRTCDNKTFRTNSVLAVNDLIKNSINTSKTMKHSKTCSEHEEEKAIMRKIKENINRKSRPIMKYVDDNNDTLNIGMNDYTNNWEDLLDEGDEECFRKIVDKVEDDVAKAKETDSDYANNHIADLEHMVELHNFPSTLETHDIVQAFSEINSDAMYVKWVDDTHAILVLGSLTQAKRAIEMDNPLIRVRPMTEASAITLATAFKNDLKPAMKRPETNIQTARRLITTHLGTKSKVSREQSLKEREDLKAAREMKKLATKNKKDAWEGNLRSVNYKNSN